MAIDRVRRKRSTNVDFEDISLTFYFDL
jgi:hypothetical protein